MSVEVSGKRVYCPDDLRVVLNLGLDGVYRLLRTKALRSVRVGHRWLIPTEAVDEFLSGASPEVKADPDDPVIPEASGGV